MNIQWTSIGPNGHIEHYRELSDNTRCPPNVHWWLDIQWSPNGRLSDPKHTMDTSKINGHCPKISVIVDVSIAPLVPFARFPVLPNTVWWLGILWTLKWTQWASTQCVHWTQWTWMGIFHIFGHVYLSNRHNGQKSHLLWSCIDINVKSGVSLLCDCFLTALLAEWDLNWRSYQVLKLIYFK